jgi:hypothetical protein
VGDLALPRERPQPVPRWTFFSVNGDIEIRIDD